MKSSPNPLADTIYTAPTLPESCPKCQRTGRNLQAVALSHWECSTERCPIKPVDVGPPVNLHGRLSDE